MKKSGILVILAILGSVAYLFAYHANDLQTDGLEIAEIDAVRKVSLEPQPSQQSSGLIPVESDFGDATFAWVRESTVLMPGSEPIPVQLRRVILVHPPYQPTRKLLDQYQTLTGLARSGDAAAARMLAKALENCSIVGSDKNAPMGTAYSQGYRSSFSYCEGVTDDHVLEAEFWAKLAAEGGDYVGIQTYAHMLGPGQERLAVMQSFWDDGNISALPTLSAEYFVGSHGGSGSKPDYVRAYAYHLIYTKVHESVKTSNGDATAPSGTKVGSAIALENHLNYLGGFLSPRDQAQAEKLAAQLLAQNGNCCTGSL